MLKSLATIVGAALIALLLSTASMAVSSSSQMALRKAAVSWVQAMSRGDTRAACRLQDTKEVAGVPCGRVPLRGGPVYCGAIGKPPLPARLNSSQQVRRTSVIGQKGSALIAESVRPIKFRGFLRLGLSHGKWQVTAFEYGNTRLAPAGLVYEGSHPIGERLWPRC